MMGARAVQTVLVAAAMFAAAFAEAGESKGPLKPGDPAPVFRLRAIDGAMIRLDELAYPGKEKSYAKKKPIFVDFFRTDCHPCMKAMPELVALYNKHAAEGLEVVLVSLLESDDGKGKLEKFLATSKLPFKVVVDENEHFAKKYLGDPVTLPATFLIDENGILKKAKYGAAGTYDEYFESDIQAVIAKWKSGGK